MWTQATAILLARIDQRIREAEAAASDRRLPKMERQLAAGLLRMHRRAEELLADGER